MPAEKNLSVVNAISILSSVGEASSPLSTSEIVAHVGLSKTAVLRILATLSERRVLERDPETNKYELGIGIVAMAQKALHRHPLIMRVSSLIEELVSATEDVGLIMVRDGDRSLCLDVRNGKFPITLGTVIGTRSPLHCGGGPFALLAFSPDDYVREYLSRPLQACTARSVTDPQQVWDRIKEARERGYTVGDEDLFEYVVAIGLPIFDNGGKLMGSISIGSINHRYVEPRRQEVVDALVSMSRRHFNSDARENNARHR